METRVSKRTVKRIQNNLQDLNKSGDEIPIILVGKIKDVSGFLLDDSYKNPLEDLLVSRAGTRNLKKSAHEGAFAGAFNLVVKNQREFELACIESIFSLNKDNRKDFNFRMNLSAYSNEPPWPIGCPYLYHYGSTESLEMFKMISNDLSQTLGIDTVGWISALFLLAIEPREGYSLHVEQPPLIATEMYAPPIDLSQCTQWILSQSAPTKLAPLPLHSKAYEYRKEFWQYFAPVYKKKDIAICKRPIYWFSVLRDIVKSSVAALDIILDLLDCDVVDPIQEIIDRSALISQTEKQLNFNQVNNDHLPMDDVGNAEEVKAKIDARSAIEGEAAGHQLPEGRRSNEHWVYRQEIGTCKDAAVSTKMYTRKTCDVNEARGAKVTKDGWSGWSYDGLYWKKHETKGKMGSVYYYRKTVSHPIVLPKEPEPQ